MSSSEMVSHSALESPVFQKSFCLKSLAANRVYSAGAPATLVMHLSKLMLERFTSLSLSFFGRLCIFFLMIFFWTWWANKAVLDSAGWAAGGGRDALDDARGSGVAA